MQTSQGMTRVGAPYQQCVILLRQQFVELQADFEGRTMARINYRLTGSLFWLLISSSSIASVQDQHNMFQIHVDSGPFAGVYVFESRDAGEVGIVRCASLIRPQICDIVTCNKTNAELDEDRSIAQLMQDEEVGFSSLFAAQTSFSFNVNSIKILKLEKHSTYLLQPVLHPSDETTTPSI